MSKPALAPDWLDEAVSSGIDEAVDMALETAADMAERWAEILEKRTTPADAPDEMRQFASAIRSLKRGQS